MVCGATLGAPAPPDGSAHPGGPSAAGAPAAAHVPVPPTGCLPTGDGYFRARLGGAIDTRIDWPNSGTQCDGETKSDPAGVRLSFKRTAGGAPDLLFLVGVTGVRRAEAAHAAGANLTVIVQGTAEIYGTRGDSRCTVDSLSQKPLESPSTFRIEARGFCTQPAHALRGSGSVLVSTFEFAGMVRYAP
jgi:hypothetical protein